MNLRFRTTLCFYKSCSYTSCLCFSPGFCLLSGLTSALGGIHSPTLLARQTWLTTAEGQRAVFSPGESKSPPRSTIPKSLTQKTGSYVFGSGGVLEIRFPTDVRESQLMVPEITFPVKQKAASQRPVLYFAQIDFRTKYKSQTGRALSVSQRSGDDGCRSRLPPGNVQGRVVNKRDGPHSLLHSRNVAQQDAEPIPNLAEASAVSWTVL